MGSAARRLKGPAMTTHTIPSLSPLRLMRVHYLWVPLLPLAFALLMLIAGGGQGSLADALARDGIDTTAEIRGLMVETETDRNGNESYKYHVTVRFTAQDGLPRTARVLTSRGYYADHAVGQRVPLRYSPSTEDAVELEPGSLRTGSRLFLGAAVIFGLAGLAAAWERFRHLPSMLRAAHGGQMRQARVTGHKDTGWKLNDTALYTMTWTDESGTQGQSRRRLRANLPDSGETITVCIDPRGARGWWVGDL